MQNAEFCVEQLIFFLNLSSKPTIMKENIVKTKSFQFAVESVNLCKELTLKKEFILSKQYLRSSTSVGANIRESCNSGTKRFCL